VLQYQRELDRVHRRFGGLRNLTRVPDLLFIVDVKREDIAVKEANIMQLPIIAMVDTNCDPDPIDHVIPANDDAIRSIRLMATKMADAVLEGQALRATLEAEREEEAALMEEAVPVEEFAGEYETEDEMYLGEATLAKLRSGMFDEDEREKAEKVAAAPAAEAEPEIAEPESEEEAVAETEPAEPVAEAMEPEEAPEPMEAVEAPVADAEPVELVEELPGLVQSAAEGDEKE
jgi:small subunit ribosomal protein S2